MLYACINHNILHFTTFLYRNEVDYDIAGRPVKIPKSYIKILDAYHLFGKDICRPTLKLNGTRIELEYHLKFDQTAREQIYVWESLGRKKYEALFGASQIDARNGYAHGKSWMDVTITMWKEDLKTGLLLIGELDYDEFIMKKLR